MTFLPPGDRFQAAPDQRQLFWPVGEGAIGAPLVVLKDIGSGSTKPGAEGSTARPESEERRDGADEHHRGPDDPADEPGFEAGDAGPQITLDRGELSPDRGELSPHFRPNLGEPGLHFRPDRGEFGLHFGPDLGEGRRELVGRDVVAVLGGTPDRLRDGVRSVPSRRPSR